jgi:murein DD-endopeptidase MepM/ murein hydrolase activator NlpD
MKKIFLVTLVICALCLAVALYFWDKSYFLCPINYKNQILIRSDARGDGLFAASRNGRRLHEGIDLFAAVGTPVRASRCGIVVSVKENRGMGKYVVIRHAGGLTTLYGHLSRVYVRKGEFVPQGRLIGAVGKSGNAGFADIQPHLHLEVRKEGIPQDPLGYLK